MALVREVVQGISKWEILALVSVTGLILGCEEGLQPEPCYFPHRWGDTANWGLPEVGHARYLAMSPLGDRIVFMYEPRAHLASPELVFFDLFTEELYAIKYQDLSHEFWIYKILSAQWSPYDAQLLLIEAETFKSDAGKGRFGRNYFLVRLDSGIWIKRIAPLPYANSYTVAPEFKIYRWMQFSTEEANYFDAGSLGMYWLEGDKILPFPEYDYIEQYRRQAGCYRVEKWWGFISPDERKIFIRIVREEGEQRSPRQYYAINDFWLPFPDDLAIYSASWSPMGKQLALVVLPKYPQILPVIWIFEDVDRLLAERPVVVKPDKVLDPWQLFCGYRFIPGANFIGEDRLVVTLIPPSIVFAVFGYIGCLYEIDVYGNLVRDLGCSHNLEE